MEKLRLIRNDATSSKYKFTVAIPPEESNHPVIFAHGLATHGEHIKRIEKELDSKSRSLIQKLNFFKKREEVDLTQWTYVHGEYPLRSEVATVTWATKNNKLVIQPSPREIKIINFALDEYVRLTKRKLTQIILTKSKPNLR